MPGVPPIYDTATYGWARRSVVRFGNLPIPIVGTTLSYIDLNDGVSWFAQDIQVDKDHRVLSVGQRTWMGEAAWIAEDWKPIQITIPYRFDEGGGVAFPAACAALLNSGEQYLTFDLNTAFKVKTLSITQKILAGGVAPLRFEGDLIFLAAVPWMTDIASSSLAPTAVSGTTGGTLTNISVAYTGTVYARPTWTLTIPVGNTAPITQVVVNNTTSGEITTVVFNPALTASTAWTITFNGSTMHITDNLGGERDLTGSFVYLYPTTQTIAVTITTSSGTTTGVTFGGSWNIRWVV